MKYALLILLFLFPVLTYASNSGDYQTIGNVSFSSSANWQIYNGSAWIAASFAPANNTNALITINSNHTAVVSDNISLNNLIVNENAVLTINSNYSLTITGNGFSILTNGILNVDGTLILNATSYFYGTIINTGNINANGMMRMYGTYRHATNNPGFPSGHVTWHEGSTCEITGVTNSLPNFSGNTFYNFTWNCPLQSSDIGFNNYLTTVNGNLSILNTNNKYITLFNSNGSLNVGGNMIFSGASYVNLSSSYIRANITVNGNFTQSGGVLNVGDGINGINIKGNFVSSGGSVLKVYGSAKINFNGSAMQYFTSTNPNPFSNKVNIEVARYSSLTLLSNMNLVGNVSSNQFYIYGYLNMNNFNISNNFYFNLTSTGTLVMGTGILSSIDTTHNVFEISSGGILHIGSPDGITSTGTTGNIRVNGTRNYNWFSKYIYNGTTAQVTGNGLPPNVSDLVISNSNGLTLTNGVIVTDSLFMISGNIYTGNNILTLQNTKPGALVYTSGLINGKFARYISNGYASYSFPLGNINSNRTALLTFTTQPSSSGIVTSQYLSGNQGGNLTDLTDSGNYAVNTYSQDGAWQFGYTGSLDAIFNLNLNCTGIQGVNTPTSLRIISRNNTSSQWFLNGSHSNGSGSPVKANRRGLTFSALTQFAIGGNSLENPLDGTLPVEMVSFTSNVSNNTDVKLNWITSSEMNNAGFEIQRKNNSNEYQKIGFVKGNNNTTATSHYSFEDKSLSTGKYSYRLKQIDNNGNFEYFELSNTVEIGAPSKFSLSQNYPNPFNPATKINYAVGTQGQVTLKIYDMTGKEVKVLVDEVKNAGFYSVDFNGAGLSSGVYVYKLTAKNFTETKKMTLVK